MGRERLAARANAMRTLPRRQRLSLGLGLGRARARSRARLGGDANSTLADLA